MDVDLAEINKDDPSLQKRKPSMVEHLEIIANSINHGLIAITSFYIVWYCYHEGFNMYQHYHTVYATIAYQVFMSEGIMVLYSGNSYTMLVGNRKTKIWIHLVLQTIGAGLALFAIPYQFIKREQTGRSHFVDSHAIIGNLLK